MLGVDEYISGSHNLSGDLSIDIFSPQVSFGHGLKDENVGYQVVEKPRSKTVRVIFKIQTMTL